MFVHSGWMSDRFKHWTSTAGTLKANGWLGKIQDVQKKNLNGKIRATSTPSIAKARARARAAREKEKEKENINPNADPMHLAQAPLEGPKRNKGNATTALVGVT